MFTPLAGNSPTSVSGAAAGGVSVEVPVHILADEKRIPWRGPIIAAGARRNHHGEYRRYLDGQYETRIQTIEDTCALRLALASVTIVAAIGDGILVWRLPLPTPKESVRWPSVTDLH